MELTTDQIENLGDLARLLFSYEDLAYMIDISENDTPAFVEQAKDKYSKIGKIIHEARFKVQAELRQRNIDSATAGSPQAMKESMEYVKGLIFSGE